MYIKYTPAFQVLSSKIGEKSTYRKTVTAWGSWMLKNFPPRHYVERSSMWWRVSAILRRPPTQIMRTRSATVRQRVLLLFWRKVQVRGDLHAGVKKLLKSSVPTVDALSVTDFISCYILQSYPVISSNSPLLWLCLTTSSRRQEGFIEICTRVRKGKNHLLKETRWALFYLIRVAHKFLHNCATM